MTTIPAEKGAEFMERGGDPALLDALLAQQKETEDRAQAAGVRFKDDMASLVVAFVAKQSGATEDLVRAQLKEMLSGVTHPNDTQTAALDALSATEKAAPPPAAMEPEAVEVEEEEEEPDYDGPLFNEKDVEIMRSAMREELAPLMGLMDMEKKMGAHVQSMMAPYAKQKDDEIATLKEAYAESQRQVAELTKRLDNLEGMQSSAARAHVPAAPVLPTVKEAAPQADPMAFFRDVYAPSTVQSVE